MRKAKEILRMKWEMGFSDRQVAASLRISHSTVGDYIKRAEQAGLDWAQIEKLGETELKGKLFPQKKLKVKPNQRPLPDWDKVHQEILHQGSSWRIRIQPVL
jgi:transposase